MTELFTPQNAAILALVFSFIAMLFSFLVWLAPRTKTDFDDKIVDGVKNGRKFIDPIATTAWHYIEEADKAGMLPPGVSKGVAFARLIGEEYKKRHGQDIPKQVEAYAESIASGMSAAEKVVKKIESLAPVNLSGLSASRMDPEKVAASVLGTAKEAIQNPPSAPASR